MDAQFPESSVAHNEQGRNEWMQKYLTSQEAQVRRGPLQWWYNLTAPATLPPNATFARRELYRRGRLASTILFCFTCVLIFLALPIGIFGPNHVILLVVAVLLTVIAIAAFFNRIGRSNITGLMISVGLNFALFTVILTNPGGLSASSLSLFDLLVFSELFVASLLPANWVFLAAAVNIAFIIVDMSLQHRAPEMVVTMQTSAFAVMFRPVALHMIVTIVLWLWVRSATQAIQRADRAEVIAALEHAMAEQEHAIAEEKRMLDISIQQIMQTHIQVANGDFNARVPLKEGAVLWPVAVSLNNLLSRLQRLRQMEQEFKTAQPRFQRLYQIEQELQRVHGATASLLQAIRKVKRELRPIPSMQSGTVIDSLNQELAGFYLMSTPDRNNPGNPSSARDPFGYMQFVDKGDQ